MKIAVRDKAWQEMTAVVVRFVVERWSYQKGRWVHVKKTTTQARANSAARAERRRHDTNSRVVELVYKCKAISVTEEIIDQFNRKEK